MKIREEPEISRITDVHHDNTLHDDGVRNTSSKFEKDEGRFVVNKNLKRSNGRVTRQTKD